MKKLFVVALLVVSASSFANSGKVAKHSKVKKAIVSCCTVGEFKSCTGDGPLDCHVALVSYCQAHTCSAATLQTIANFRPRTLTSL